MASAETMEGKGIGPDMRPPARGGDADDGAEGGDLSPEGGKKKKKKDKKEKKEKKAPPPSVFPLCIFGNRDQARARSHTCEDSSAVGNVLQPSLVRNNLQFLHATVSTHQLQRRAMPLPR